MSFTVHARRVRDESLSPARRGAALSSAVVLYRPFGFTWTHAYLSLFGDTRRDPRAMVTALEVLERSRTARTAEWAEFSRRRTTEKHEAHRRTPSAADRAWAAAPRWPGPDLHHAHRAMVLRWSCLPTPTAAELRREGLTELERAVTAQVDAYLATDRPDPGAAAVLGGLLPRLREAAARTRGGGTGSRAAARAHQLRMMAELVHWDRGPEPAEPTGSARS
ncbi:hypothetical protein [Streptomyces sp. NRRL S-378]|uniref:hypothetical protein n=1 Tax=Streptomyces sp. NRRL S-378 TaxID=1463904 RepID=UPI0004CB06C1|nr:hypothetical protein [Streptomyces sp. NRRL S-378]